MISDDGLRQENRRQEQRERPKAKQRMRQEVGIRPRRRIAATINCQATRADAATAERSDGVCDAAENQKPAHENRDRDTRNCRFDDRQHAEDDEQRCRSR